MSDWSRYPTLGESPVSQKTGLTGESRDPDAPPLLGRQHSASQTTKKMEKGHGKEVPRGPRRVCTDGSTYPWGCRGDTPSTGRH